MAEKRYGFYSVASANAGHGTNWYSTPDGRVVEVTVILDDPTGSAYLWPDKTPLGEVVAWVRAGQPNTRHRQHFYR